MTRHVSAETMARYREGDLSRRRAARISAHLAGCASCARVNADLAAVSSLLARVELPSIPDHLAARLESVLATESAARAVRSPAQAAGEPGSATVTPGAAAPVRIPGRPDLPERTGHRRRLRMPRLSSPLVLGTLAVASAVVVVAGGGYLLLSGVHGPATAPSAGAARSAPSSGKRIFTPLNGSAATGLFSLPYAQDGTIHTVATLHSAINFKPATLASQVRREVVSVRSVRLAGPSQPAEPKPTSGARQLFDAINILTLEGCVSLVADGRDVLLVDLARYEGNPATVIVAAVSATARTLYVSVVSRACSASHSDVIFSASIPSS